ncbi:hypothetical protein MNEG_1916, partial [Monoraphidium neglectum]
PELDPLLGRQPPVVDIAPGKPGLSPLPYSPSAWATFSLIQPPDAVTARGIFDLGRKDAHAWAAEVGLARAAAAAAAGRRRL